MVQDADRKVRRGFFPKLARLLRRKVVEVPLEFRVDLDAQGRHTIEVWLSLPDGRRRVTNIRDIWDYGFSFLENDTVYTVARSGLETLLAIRSLNPQIAPDGRLVSDIYPPVLNYLRSRGRIDESEGSKRIAISEKPIERGAKVSFDPALGVSVRAGYQRPGNTEVMPLGGMPLTPDRSFVRIGDTFYALPEESDPNVKRWIDSGETTIGLDDVPEFFKKDLVLLRSNFQAVLTEGASAIRVYDEVRPTVVVSLEQPGWLDFRVEYVANTYTIPHDVFKHAPTKFVRQGENAWVRKDAAVIAEVEQQLKALGAIQTAKGFRVDVTKFPSLEDFIQRIGGQREVSAEYARFLAQITDFHPDEGFPLPDAMERDLLAAGITLRPYQRAGVHWLHWLTQHYLHGILADDMGLGKTIQMALDIRLAYETNLVKSHSLIICPRSVVRHWSREVARVFPGAAIYEYTGPLRDPTRFSREEATVFITTYDTAARDLDVLSAVPFSFVVLDEGTKIKNPDSLRAKGVKALNAAHRFALSGTPIENRPAELWSIFDFLMRGHLGTFGGFVSGFEKPIVAGDGAAATKLAGRIRPFILRRLKEQVAKDLPEKIEMKEWCGLTDEQKSLYAQLQDIYLPAARVALLSGGPLNYTTSILPILTKLKQVCDHPALINKVNDPITGRSEKFDLVLEKLHEIRESGDSAVVFTHFLGTLDLLERQMEAQGQKYIRIDGSTRDRQGLVDQFNAGKASVALCSLLAAGQGLNLIGANHVIHVDRWWNPAVEDQATDRVHRIGQTNTVYVHKILTEGTLEEKIDRLLEKKKRISDTVIGAATAGEIGWTKEELLDILEPIGE